MLNFTSMSGGRRAPKMEGARRKSQRKKACSILLAALMAGFGLSLAGFAKGDEPFRIGIVGLDNYQAVAFTSLFHDPAAEGDLKGLRVVAAYAGGSPDIAESVESLPKWIPASRDLGVEIVDSIDKVLEKSDGILLMSLDGRVHWPHFKVVAKAGKPVYIGRPLVASLADAVRVFDLAKSSGTPVFSCSQHRFSPGFIGMRNHPEVGAVLGCDVFGGCPMEPSHPDLFWHAVHEVETLYTIMGPGCASVTRASTPQAEFVTGTWTDGRIGTFRGIRAGAIKYRAMVFGDKGISPSGDYGYDVPVNWVAPHGEYMGYKGLAREIGRFMRTKEPPVPAEETLEIFAFMEAAHESKARGGAPVELAEILAKAKKEAASKPD